MQHVLDHHSHHHACVLLPRLSDCRASGIGRAELPKRIYCHLSGGQHKHAYKRGSILGANPGGQSCIMMGNGSVLFTSSLTFLGCTSHALWLNLPAQQLDFSESTNGDSQGCPGCDACAGAEHVPIAGVERGAGPGPSHIQGPLLLPDPPKHTGCVQTPPRSTGSHPCPHQYVHQPLEP